MLCGCRHSRSLIAEAQSLVQLRTGDIRGLRLSLTKSNREILGGVYSIPIVEAFDFLLPVIERAPDG